jgi:WD40 repeat protein
LTHARWFSLVLVAGAIVQTAGCKKEQDSLILVAVRANAPISDLTSLTLSAEGTAQVYDISGLSGTSQEFGLYVSSSVVGIVKVTAIASRGTCDGYKGQGTATIARAGATSDPPTTIVMTSADICSPDGGAGTNGTGGASSTGGATGQGGSTGTGGASSTGGATGQGGSTGTGGLSGACALTPPPGTPPGLTCCQEYQHESNCLNDAGVWGVAFSPDGHWLVTGGDDNLYRLWSFDGHTLTSQQQSWTAPGGIGYGYLAFSPDGKYLALGGEGAIAIYDVGTWHQETSLAIDDYSIAYGVGFTPDSQHVVSMDGSTIYLHALGTAAALTSAPFSSVANGLAVSSVAVSGAVAIAAGGQSTSGALGAIFTYIAPSTLNGPATVTPVAATTDTYTPVMYAAAISPNGSSVAFGDTDASVWFSSYPSGPVSPAQGAELLVDSSGSQLIEGLAYSQDGGSLAVVGASTPTNYVGTISIWSLAARAVTAQYLDPSFRPVSVTFSPAGNALVVGEYDCGVFLLCTN